MSYLYAIGETSEQSLPHLAGIGGAPPEALAVGGVTLVLSRARRLPEDRLAALRRHESVVEAVMTTRPVLPFRFGTLVSDLESVAAAIRSNLPAILGNLGRVAGCVELGLAVGEGRCRRTGQDQGDTAPSTSSGRDYLARLCRQDADRRGAVSRLTDRVSPLDARLRRLSRCGLRLEGGRSGSLLRFTYLVPVGCVSLFQREVTQARKDERMPALFASGPWPPYSFVEDGLLPSGPDLMAR